MKGYTEGEVYPAIIAGHIGGEVEHIYEGGTLESRNAGFNIDASKIRRFAQQDFRGSNHVRRIIDYICDRYIGKVIIHGKRKTMPFPMLVLEEFPYDPEHDFPEKTRTKAEVEAVMANAEQKITSDEIVDDIERELEVTMQLGDVEGFNIDTGVIKSMIVGEPEGWKEVLRLMRYTTDRFVGDKIVAGSQGVDPWPRRSL
jgi:hypothetical protein